MADAHDIMVLALSLAQLKSSHHVIKLFTEALEEIWPRLRFEHHPHGAGHDRLTIPIVTVNRSFGHIALSGELDEFDSDGYALMRHAVSLLAIILDRSELERLAFDDCRSHDDSALEQTRHTREANRALEETNRSLQAEILERKRAERDRDRLFNYSLDLLAIIDFSGRFRQVNPSWTDTLGWTADELIGGACMDFIHPEDRAATAEIAERLRMGEEIRCFENRCARKSGGYCVLSWSSHPFMEEQLVFSVVRDVTDSKTVQERMRQSERLEAVGQLAGGIAHDFNNQLAGIMGYADLMREELATDSRMRRYADNIIVSVKRASDLTQQLLAYARKGKYLSVPLDLHRIVLEVVSLLKHSIDKRIQIRQRFEANSAVTAGDPSQVQNAILNLALNARDAMPDGGTLTFATDTAHADQASAINGPLEIGPGDYIRLRVIDTGSGISPEVQKHMFEPFFTTKGEGRGTGMGLAAVYGTVQHHNGGLQVESGPGQGTSIALYFPLIDAHPHIHEKPIEITTGSAHVLLIDDEISVCNVGSDILKKLGYRVTIHQDSIGAVEFFRRTWSSVDLVILDLVMPRMGGKEVFAELKMVNPDVKVIIASGYSIEGEAQQLLHRGALDFVQKPFRIGVLSQKIAAILNT